MPTLPRLLTALLRRTPPVGEPLSDAELLARFATSRDSAAFELLVWRHGATVLGVCRRMLRHEQSAEDAFQAVFLILARKAGAVRTQLAGFLHTTARRVCLRLAKRTAFAALEAEPPAAVPPDAVENGELTAVLDAEIARLPEKFRLAVILCYLRGLSTEQAAEHLNVPRGTVLSRLASARKRLVDRLTAKGITMPTAFLSAAVTTGELAAEVCGGTATAAVGFVTSDLAVTVPSQLATEVLSMTTHKAVIAVAVAVVLMTGVGTGLGWALADGEQPGDAPKPTVKAEPAKPLPPADLGPDHPAVKRRQEQLLELEKRIDVEQATLLHLQQEADKVGQSRAGEARLVEELMIDLAKKKLDAEIALAGSKVELRDAEDAFQKLSGKAEDRQRFQTEVVAISERLAVVRGKEQELLARVEKAKAAGVNFEKQQAMLDEVAKDRVEAESVLHARKTSLESVTAQAAEADAKRQAAERAKSNLTLWAHKLELIQEKLARLEAAADNRAGVQRRLVALGELRAVHQQQLNRLKEMKFELELPPMTVNTTDKSDDKLDRILKRLEELRRDVKKLQAERK